MNFIRRFIYNGTTDEIALIQQGLLFLKRLPNSPKGSSECLYNDAVVTIKKTNVPFSYQLIVSRLYQEGESSIHQEEFDLDDDELTDDGALNVNNQDEWSFTISDSLNFNVLQKKDGSYAINWNDINGDIGDRFEFNIDEEIKFTEIKNFQTVLFKCLYELKYLKTCLDPEGLKEFETTTTNDTFTIDDVKKDILKYNNSFKFNTDSDYEDYEDSPKPINLEVSESLGSSIKSQSGASYL